MLPSLSYLYFLILFFSLPLSIFADELKDLDHKERILLENFEVVKFTNQSIQIQANTNYLPDVRMSKNLTAPDLISNTSLLIRIPSAGSGIPMDLIFPEPYFLEDYLVEIEFPIYSNRANGELFLYILDSKFQKHKILIANLNYDGWKSFKIPIGNRVTQNDFIIGKSSSIKIVGIQINLARKEVKDKEDLIAIDDIFITKRKRYKLPANGLEGFH